MQPRQQDRDDTVAQVPRNKEGKVHFLPILTTALVLRIILAISVIKNGPQLYNQASELSCLAESIIDGHGFSSPFGGYTGPSAFLAPGYPMLVAAAFRLFGVHSLGAAAMIIAIQIVFGVLIVWTLMLLAKRLFGSNAANIAGLLAALSLTLIWLPVLFWETSLSTLLLTGMLLFALRCADDPKTANWAAIGLYCAFAMFINPALMVTFAAVLAWAVWQSRAVRGSRPYLAVIVWVLVFSIWPIRNAYRLHTFIPLRTNLGYELWQGNRPGSDGIFSAKLHPNVNRHEYARYAALGEVAYMREKSTLAKAAIMADIPRFLRLTSMRMARFWFNLGGFESSVILTLDIALTSLFSAAGLVLLFRRSWSIGILMAIPFLLFPAPYYLTHADFRFRLLLNPLALLLTTIVLQACYAYARALNDRSNSDGKAVVLELSAASK